MKLKNLLPFNGSVSEGNGVTISFDGTLTVDPSSELALPLVDFSVAKVLIDLKLQIKSIFSDDFPLTSIKTYLF